MAAKTFYFKDAVASGASNHRSLADGAAPSTAVTATGWTINSKASGQACLQNAGVEVSRTSGSWGTTLQPSGSPDDTVGDCWRSENTYNGTFDAGNWTINVQLESVTAAYTGRCRIGYRLWRSTAATGSGATEITSGRQVTAATAANLSTSSVTTVSGTVNPGSVVLTNEYLFIQIGIEVTSAGSSNTQDALMVVSNAADIVTPNFTINGDVTLALNATSTSATFSAGKLGVGTDLHGQGATFAQGTLTPATGAPLTGQGATFAQGRLNVGTSLTGRDATFAQGTLTVSKSCALTGQGATFGQGRFGVGQQLTGQSAGFSAGSLSVWTPIAPIPPQVPSDHQQRILLAVLKPKAVSANAYTTLDPSSAWAVNSAGVVGGNLQLAANASGATNIVVARSTLEISGGRHYWETTHNWLANCDSSAGLVTTDEILTPSGFGAPTLAGQHQLAGPNKAGDVSYDGTLVYALGAQSSNAKVRHYFDADSGLYQIAVNGGPWITVANDPLLAAFKWKVAGYCEADGITNASTLTFNFGATAFTYSTPLNARTGVYSNSLTNVTLYVSSDEFRVTTGATIDGLTIPNQTVFDSRVASENDVVITTEGSCWVHGGESQSSRGQIQLILADGQRDAWIDYLWRDADVTILEIYKGQSISLATTWAKATVEDDSYDDGTLTLTLTDRLATLDRPAQTTLYDDKVNNPQLINTPKPFGFGRPLYCEGALLEVAEAANDAFTYDLGGDIGLYDISAIYDMGDIFEPGVDWNFSNSGSGFKLVNKPVGKIVATPVFSSFSALEGMVDNGTYPDGYQSGVTIVYSGNGGRFAYTDPSWTTTHTDWTTTTTGGGSVTAANIGAAHNEGATVTSGGGTALLQTTHAAGVVVAGNLATTMHWLRFDLYELTGQLLIVEDTGTILAVVDESEPRGPKSLWIKFATTGTNVRKIGFKSTNGSFTINNVRLQWQPPYPSDYVDSVIPTILRVFGGMARIDSATAIPNFDTDALDALVASTGVAYRLAYFNKGDQITVQELIRQVMNSFTGSAFCTRLNTISFGRYDFPKADRSAADFEIDTTNIIGVPERSADRAEGLTTTLQGGKNNTVHADSDLTSLLDADLRAELTSEYTITKVASYSDLEAAVNPQLKQAIAAKPLQTMLQEPIAVQTEANRVGTLWRANTKLIDVTATLDRAVANTVEPFTTVWMTYPRYGFDNGKPALVKRVTRSFFSNALTLQLFQPDADWAYSSTTPLRITGTPTKAIAGQPFVFTPLLANSSSPMLSQTGTLPTGVTFNSATGELVGTPTGADATYTGTITGVNSDGSVAKLNYTFRLVNPTTATSGLYKATDGQTLVKNRAYTVSNAVSTLVLPEETGLNGGDWVELSKEDINIVTISSDTLNIAAFNTPSTAGPDDTVVWNSGVTIRFVWNGTYWMINV